MTHAKWNFDGQETLASDGAVIKWEDETFFTISYNGNTFFGEILEENTESNLLKLKINHRVFTVGKKGPLDELISSLGMDVPKVRKLKELQAPMPGRIVNIAVQVGQEVNVGDEILSLEAMKMELAVKASRDGVVADVRAVAGDFVEADTVLVALE